MFFRKALRSKKYVLTLLLAALGLYSIVQVVYLQQAWSPLRLLASAENEAQRLLKCVTTLNLQCNNTWLTGNQSHWPICIDNYAGVDIETKTKIVYSIGPSHDFAFERVIAQNLSLKLFIFSHNELPNDIVQMNNTHVYKTIIKANDPADFSRNSYSYHTVNHIQDMLGHKQVNILKMDQVIDISQSHELLYFMIKDGLLRHVQQLHMAIHIDTIDNDDYIYKWYRALFSLFHTAGFRLYHSIASDPLCVQVTMMESCVYYLSWVQDPGPLAFILYPPAIDGSVAYEEKRLMDFVETDSVTCHRTDILTLKAESGNAELKLCHEQSLSGPLQQCSIFIIRPSNEKMALFHNEKMALFHNNEWPCRVNSYQIIGDQKFKNLDSGSEVSLLELVHAVSGQGTVDVLYLSIPSVQVLTSILSSGLLIEGAIRRLVLDIALLGADNPAYHMRHTYSELRRLEQQGFYLHHVTPIMVDGVNSRRSTMDNCCYRMSFLKQSMRVT